MFNSCRDLDTRRWLIRAAMLTPDWSVLAYKSPTVVKQSDSPGGGKGVVNRELPVLNLQ